MIQLSESPAIMEQIQSLQSFPNSHTTIQDQNFLPTEMECQIDPTLVPFRASPRKHVGAHVLSTVEISRADESRIPCAQ